VLGALAAAIVLIAAQFVYQLSSPAGSARLTTAGVDADASIAVLAFSNMSGDPKNEYFSDGISEDLLNDLAQVQGLHVAGRTSSFSFKGKNATIAEIGRALNVRTVLEGSVQRDGNRVRIIAQLNNAADGYHLWSADYDREITDIFAVQDEIARAITTELAGRLLGTRSARTTVKAHSKINPDAYTAYLQGRFFMNKRNRADMLRAEDFFRQAIKLEPDYADAHASLALAIEHLIANAQVAGSVQSATDEMNTALKLDPNNLDALLLRASIADDSWRWSEAYAAFRQIRSLAPNSAEVHHVYGVFLYDVGLPNASLAEARRAVALDPLSPVSQSNVGSMLYILNRSDEAVRAFQAVLTLSPDFTSALFDLCRIYAHLRDLHAATDLLQTKLIPQDGRDGDLSNECKIFIANAEGNRIELTRQTQVASEAYAQGHMAAFRVALSYARAGNIDAAMQWLRRAYSEKERQLFVLDEAPDFPNKLAADPRWKAMMQSPPARELERVRDEIVASGGGS
jgi:TolB-like protein